MWAIRRFVDAKHQVWFKLRNHHWYMAFLVRWWRISHPSVIVDWKCHDAKCKKLEDRNLKRQKMRCAENFSKIGPVGGRRTLTWCVVNKNCAILRIEKVGAERSPAISKDNSAIKYETPIASDSQSPHRQSDWIPAPNRFFYVSYR